MILFSPKVIMKTKTVLKKHASKEVFKKRKENSLYIEKKGASKIKSSTENLISMIYERRALFWNFSFW